MIEPERKPHLKVRTDFVNRQKQKTVRKTRQFTYPKFKPAEMKIKVFERAEHGVVVKQQQFKPTSEEDIFRSLQKNSDAFRAQSARRMYQTAKMQDFAEFRFDSKVDEKITEFKTQKEQKLKAQKNQQTVQRRPPSVFLAQM